MDDEHELETHHLTATSPSSEKLVDRPRSGVVALVDRASITVADLLIGPAGVTVRRWVVVFNGAGDLRYIDTDAKSAVAALARVLAENGFPNKLAAVGLTDSMFGAALCDLPKTSTEALSALIVKRVREQVVDPPDDLLADHSVMDLPRVEKAAPDRVRKGYLAWSSKALMEGFQREFQAHELAVGRLMPPAVALLDLFGRTRPDDETRLELFARYCYPSLVIGVCGAREPLYLRFLPDLMADATEGVVATVLQEVRRTAAFVTENHPNARVQRLCFSGLSANDGASLTARLRAQGDMDAESLHMPVEGPASEADPERLAVLASLLLHGAPLRGRNVRAMDLLPKSPPRVSRSLVALGAFMVLGLVACMTSLFLAKSAVEAGTTDVAALEGQFTELTAGASERVVARREAHALAIDSATLGVLSAASGNPVQPLLEALLLAPPEARITAASIDNPFRAGAARAQLDLRLSGDFSSDGGAARLHARTAQLAARPWCADLRITQGGLKAAAGKVGLAEDVGLKAWLR
jgi:hypothetical protein